MIEKRRTFIIITIIIIVVLIIFFTYQTYENRNNTKINEETKESINTPNNTNRISEDYINDQNNENQNQETLNENYIEGSGGGGSDKVVSPKDKTCKTTRLIYSIETINQTQICKSYNNETCIEKKVYCSARINNKDIVTGTFEIEAIFVPNYGNKNIEGFGKINENLTINPSSSRVISNNFEILSVGEDGLANKKINCFFYTVDTPEKTTCS